MQAIHKLRRVHYCFINSIVPYKYSRWAFTAAIALAYADTTQNLCSDLTTYLIAFYLLILIVNYFIPRGASTDVEGLYDDEDDDLYSLNTSLGSSFSPQNLELQLQFSSDKPLVRQMSEVQIWERTSVAFSLGLICSYFKMLEIDVFWPLLLFYFVALALYTILKIIRTMRKYQYGLADFHKQPLK